MRRRKYVLCLLFAYGGHSLGSVTFNQARAIIPLIKSYLPEDPIILEAGAYDGEDSVFLAQSWPQAQIHSFEPIPVIYTTLQKNARVSSNIQTYNLALSNSSGMKPFHISTLPNDPLRPSQSSSLRAPKDHLIYAPVVHFNSTISVPCTTIDEWAQQHAIEKIDFMWLDLQGSELDVLKAATQLIRTVKVILTEIEFVEAYEGQALYNEIKSWLEEQGFEMVAFNDVHGWFGDAVFVRP